MKKKTDWKKMKNVWISIQPVLPGVWRRKEGGHVVRGRATDGKTGLTKDIFRVLPETDEQTALKWLRDEQARIRSGVDRSLQKRKERFGAFAASLFEHKVKVKDIKSAAGRNKWRFALEHLVGGTTDGRAKKHVEGFGDFYVDKISTCDLERWKEEQAALISAGDYAPTTVNTWMAVLRVIMKAAKTTFGLSINATDVAYFDTCEHEPYTDEEPNALLPAEAPAFLAKMRELYPQHFAMTYLGLITGLRPSTLRPLRRTGPQCDVIWAENRIAVRRSHTAGEEVMNTTKQRRRYKIDLPEEAMSILRWHVETQLGTPEQKQSELLFPGIDGRFRSTSVLKKPFDEVASELGLHKRITPRALRRTFNDLARAAQVQDVVTRSISGHLTEDMQRHYSTVSGEEQRRALAKVIDLTKVRAVAATHRGAGGEQSGEQNGRSGEQPQTAR